MLQTVSPSQYNSHYSALPRPSRRVVFRKREIGCSFYIKIGSFSTLQAGRVAATKSVSILPGQPMIFQYPPSGSSRCNPQHLHSTTNPWYLSVTSKQVEPLQPQQSTIQPTSLFTFHTPP